MRILVTAGLVLSLTGCAGTWSTSEVQNPGSTPITAVAGKKPKTPAAILVTEKDVTDKKYRVLGDIDVTVNKTTIFHADPTREKVDEELKLKAVELGADAVILVRYGTVGVSMMSWGSLNGKGRAIAYVD